MDIIKIYMLLRYIRKKYGMFISTTYKKLSTDYQHDYPRRRKYYPRILRVAAFKDYIDIGARTLNDINDETTIVINGNKGNDILEGPILIGLIVEILNRFQPLLLIGFGAALYEFLQWIVPIVLNIANK